MRYQRTNDRRAVILMVVLSLLTLFALVGITFVLYADAEAAAARVAREAETAQRADMDPQQALSFLLGQILYDVNDTATGAASGLRGHSLARNMYGYNVGTTGLNNTAFNGVGRVHTGAGAPGWPAAMNPYALDDYLLPNYTWFSGDGFVRDPEWYGTLQTTPGTGHGTSTSFVGGNAPYTYADLNSFFLAAVRSDGTVLSPSYHRPWLFQVVGGKTYAFNDMTNPNWTSPQGKYMTLRPRPQEHPGFPGPDDAVADVKNLPWSQTNDSIWIDPGGPVMIAPDGTPFKMLVAPCIIDLDNRINIAAAGNVAGGNTAGRSNQGWFFSEVNLSALWGNSASNAAEWLQLFLGNGTYKGKYGTDQVPSGPELLAGSAAHVYAQADWDGRNEASGAATGPIQLPGTIASAPNGATALGTSCFPYFPPGYGNGSPAERTTVTAGKITYRHPGSYSVYKPPYYTLNTVATAAPPQTIANDDMVFGANDMEALLRPINWSSQTLATWGDAGGSALISNLTRLCPKSLANPQSVVVDTSNLQRRNWITTVSSDLASPGLSPWIFNDSLANPTLQPYSTFTYPPTALAGTTATPSLPPFGNPTPFPPFADLKLTPPFASGSTDFSTATWQSLTAALGRVDLNRRLPPYPHLTDASGLMTVGAAVAPTARFDAAGAASPTMVQFQAAMAARQQLTIDVYSRLVAVTGVSPPSNPAAPTNAEIAVRRWLAQLAVNIVDYIDADDISTPFNFYNPANPPFGLPTVPVAGAYNSQLTPTADTIPAYGAAGTSTTGAPSAGAANPDLPTYWVFGTELPRVVINEVLGEYTVPTNKASPPAAQTGAMTVNLWVELFSPMQSTATVTAMTNGPLQPQDINPEPLYMLGPGGPGNTTAAQGAYNIYQLEIANNNLTPSPYVSYGLWYDNSPANQGINNNVTGTPQQLRYNSSNALTICNFTLINGDTLTPASNGTVGTVAAPTTASYPLYPSGGAWGLYGGSPTPVAGQPSYMIVGPSATDANNDIVKGVSVPGTTPLLLSPTMSYQVQFTAPNTWKINIPGGTSNPVTILDNTNGVNVVLRRLANPHLPPNPFTPAGVLANPAMPPNPYISVDYLTGVQLNGYGSNGTNLVPVNTFNPPIVSPLPKPTSLGKPQPYVGGSFSGQVTQQSPTPAVTPSLHTLGSLNQPIQSPFTWLVHLDRPLISPMELLHVSGFAPHLLTQRFIYLNTGTIANTNPQIVPQPYKYTAPSYFAGSPPVASNPAGYIPANYSCFQHYVPWFDQTNRLYRFFEMVETHNPATGISPVNGRVPGKININTLWDPPTTYGQIYQAIADPPLAPTTPNNPNFTSGNVTTAFNTLLTWRTPGLALPIPALSQTDRPFLGMAAGTSGIDPQYPATYGFTAGNGIYNTLFTSGVATTPPQPPLPAIAPGVGAALQLQNTSPTTAAGQANYPQGAHPYLQNELLTKIYSRLTTRSNVYAVFLTVGFFQVTGTVAGSTLPQLGPEIGRSEGRQIRHRMFAIVDRTNIQSGSALCSTVVTGQTAGSAGPPPPFPRTSPGRRRLPSPV